MERARKEVKSFPEKATLSSRVTFNTGSKLAPMGTTSASLLWRLDDVAKVEVGQKLVKPDFSLKDMWMFREYFDFYESELIALQFGRFPSVWPDPDLAAESHSDILHIVEELRRDRGSARPKIRETLELRFPSANVRSVNRSIDLAIRLWLMVNVRDPDLECQNPPQTPMLQWNDSTTFDDFLTSLFPMSRWELEAKSSRLHPYFKVANMVRICGLKLAWTKSLEDHLRLDRQENESILRVYPYKCLLQGQLDGVRNSGGHGSM